MSRTRLTGLALLHIHHNMEIDLDKIIQSADLQGFIREEWNWPISCLNDSGTQERGLREFRSLRLRCSFRKSVTIYSRSAPVYVLILERKGLK